MITSYVAILAGNLEQFKRAVKDGDWKPHEKPIYIPDADSARGCEFSRYEVIGTFYQDNKNPSQVLSRVRERLI